MSAAQAHVTQGPEISTSLLGQAIAQKGAMWQSLGDAGGKIADAVISRNQERKTFFGQQQDVFSEIAKQRKEIDYAHLQEFDNSAAGVKDELTSAFKTMRPSDWTKPEFQTWLRKKKDTLAGIIDRNKSSKEQYPEIVKLYNDPNIYGEKMMAAWRENESKRFDDPTYNPNFLATAQNSSEYTNIVALAAETMKKKDAVTHNYVRVKDGFSDVMSTDYRPSLGYMKDNNFVVKVDPTVTDELLKNPRFYEAMVTQLHNGTEGTSSNTIGIDMIKHNNDGNGGQIEDAVRQHAQSYLEEIAKKEFNPEHVIKSRTQITSNRKPTAAEEQNDREWYNARSLHSDIQSGTSDPFNFYSSDPKTEGYSGFTPVYGGGKGSPPTSYTAKKTEFSKDKNFMGKHVPIVSDVSIPATPDGLKNFIAKYNEGKATKVKIEPTAKKEIKKEIKDGIIPEMAKKANMSVEEYKKVLNKNGVKIIK